VTTSPGAGAPPATAAGVVLIGPPTAGKSSVGALLARELGVPFADTDDAVAAAAGKPVGDIFVDEGELVFRELERAAVARGLETIGTSGASGASGASGTPGPAGGVLALGSGAVLDPDVRRMIAGRFVVYLEAGFATVAKRTGMDRPRVVIPGNPRGRLRTMLEERRPVYAELATITVPTDDMAPEEVAADLAKRLRA
jgi:shikimate kinase